MNHEELGSIRYALGIGVEKLESTTLYLRHINSKYFKSAQESAENAKVAYAALEDAVQEWAVGIKK